MISPETIKSWLSQPEDPHLEFKAARHQFDGDALTNYCVAFANERGGRLVLGVTDKQPREIVGTDAIASPQNTKRMIRDRLHIRVDITVLEVDGRRVVVVEVPPRPTGWPIHYKGVYLMRSGEDLMPMTPEQLLRIFQEPSPGFSAQVCSDATLDDLEPTAIAVFREKWAQRSGNRYLDRESDLRLLQAAEIVLDGGVTYAALVLLGRPQALALHLPQAEVVIEYRATEEAGPAQQRVELRKGFLLFADELWTLIDLRNDTQHFQQGFFVTDIPTFSEAVVREAVLNAVSHRDYRLKGSVFIRQYPRRLEVVSPGGWPPGITVENILYRQEPRNRRLAEAFSKCGLVERAGQGMNRMFAESVRDSKALPNFDGTDDYQVSVTLHGTVQDPGFVRFLEQIGREHLTSFTTDDFVLLDILRRSQPIPEHLRDRLKRLVDLDVAERVGRGRGTRYILCRRFYAFVDEGGTYTRARRLDRETNKQLLLKHIRDSKSSGSPLRDLLRVLPQETRETVQGLLRQMQGAGVVHCRGRTRGARWYPGPKPSE